MTRRMREYYVQRGIDLFVFDNTILDLRYKLEECKLVKGIRGTADSKWFIGFLRLARFALGRLQFEVIELGYNYNGHGVSLTPESKVVNIHIPRSQAPLTPESCDEACKMAKEFLKGQYDEPCGFVCRSWLLFPLHKEFLPKHTNTYKFCTRFEVIASGTYKEDTHLWRLFDTDEKNYERLPTDTSIRRAYVEHLKNGGKTGWAIGIFFL